ncbi:MAG: hypothetical protein IPI41_19490 [Flavobacteriales bacterium]|nr:hypothetical protein [Flavobacteriales bacterium]
MRIPLSSLALLPLLACSQYNGPESVEYDPAGDRYFVSNTSDGTIKQRDQIGTVTPFASVSPSPYGLEILGDTLYTPAAGQRKGYLRLSTGAFISNLNLGGASSLNGITTDAAPSTYVTDFSDEKIFRGIRHEHLLHHLGGHHERYPNGIAAYDATHDLLFKPSSLGQQRCGEDLRAQHRCIGLVHQHRRRHRWYRRGLPGGYLIASWSPGPHHASLRAAGAYAHVRGPASAGPQQPCGYRFPDAVYDPRVHPQLRREHGHLASGVPHHPQCPK